MSGEDRRRQYYRVLSGETDRLHQMVENLLDFGRMEAGKAEYRFGPVDIGALVEQVVGAFGNGTSARERLTMSVVGPPVRVNADREGLSRALWNLLDNAVKYSPPVAPLEVAVDRGEGEVSIRVRDRGPGIPPAERKQIFAKFYRGAEAKTSGVKGTGLGLATVQHIVRAHRGRVMVDSTPGEGSTFTIVLPAAKEERS